ncbi:MAG: PilZ domain-containing protein [Desulfovibrionaceae bacterium]
MGYDISFGDGEDRARQAFRTRVPDLDVKFHATGRIYGVLNLSATGFAVHPQEIRMPKGQEYEVSLYLNKKLLLDKAVATVVRIMEDGYIGLAFFDLTRQQALKLDKLVLEVQKRLIELRKSRLEE